MKTAIFALRQFGLFMCGALIMQVILQHYKVAAIYGLILAIIFIIKWILEIADEARKGN